jgi:signal transduction histidine kinase
VPSVLGLRLASSRLAAANGAEPTLAAVEAGSLSTRSRPSSFGSPNRRLGLVAASFATAAGFTALVVFVRAFDVAYRSPSMHVAIETVAAFAGLTASYLVFGRYQTSARLADLLLALSFLVLAIGSLFFSVLPAALSGDDVTRFSTWAPVMSGLVGAVGLAVSVHSRGVLQPRPRTLALVGVAFLSVVSSIAAVTYVLASRLPVAIPPALSPVQGGRELVIGQPAALAVQLSTMVLFAGAAAGFLSRGRRTGDELMLTLAVASVVGAFASFNYFLFPSLYSQWVYSGDILHFSFYVIILFGVARELNSYWRGLAHTAALEERRRIARDLHDGLAQELAFIVRKSRLLGAGQVETQLASAAERALAESRQAIAALTRPLDEPLEVTLARAAEEVATRFGLELRLELVHTDLVSHSSRDALRRIVREATTNAARHGGAEHVSISFDSVDGRLCLRIRDDGCGFDPSREYPGFGLISMQERTASLGGSWRLSSAAGAGTTVEVRLP